MNTFFLKGRVCTPKNKIEEKIPGKENLPYKFIGSFEIIAFNTRLSYQNFYEIGRESFFKLFDITCEEMSTGPVSEGNVGSSFLFVLPRMGTVSPWASKAQNILDNTYKDVVDRVELCHIFLFVTN